MPIVFADGFDHYDSAGTGTFNIGNIYTGWYGESALNADYSSAGFVSNRTGKALRIGYQQYPGYYYTTGYGGGGLFRQFTITNNVVTIGFLIRWPAGSSDNDTATIKVGTSNIQSLYATTSNNASVFRLGTTTVLGTQVFKVIYNGVTTVLNSWVFDTTTYYYIEFQFDTTPSTGYAKMRINGVLVWESLNDPPNQSITTIGGYALIPNHTNSAYLDDFYIATGDANFYGPLSIDDITNLTLQNSSNYTANTGTVLDALNSMSTTTYVSTTNSNSNVILKGTTTNAVGYLIHQCSRNVDAVPYSLQTTEGENDLAMNDRVNYILGTSFQRRQHLLLASDILDQGDPTDGNGPYHFFGFRIKDNS